MTLDVELDRPGRHFGALRIPWSRDASAYGQLVVPVIVLRGAPGPTLLVTAGVHGDEYEGQVVLPELARTLEPSSLRGRLVLVPRANLLAVRAGRRTSPEDGGNLARLFPGTPGAGVSSALAAAITTSLLPLADAVLDLHAGGSSLDYLPCAWGRLPSDAALAARTLDMLAAFGAPLTAITAIPQGNSTLVAQALARGCPAMATELGGSGAVTPATLTLARDGCRRIMAHLGIIPDAPRPRPARLLAVQTRHFLRSPGLGLFEPHVGLGAAVAQNDTAGLLHDPERPDLPPRRLAFATSGLLICRRVPAPCEPGDVLAHLAEDTTTEALLRR